MLHRRSFHITSERPKNIYGIPLHVAVKLICLTIGLWICLSKDNVLLLLQYDMGGQLAVLPGKAENLRNVNCSCHGSDTRGGGVNLTVQYSLSLYIHLPLHYM